MKHTFLAIFAGLLLFGAGCLNPVSNQGTSPSTSKREPSQTTQMQQEVSDLLGVIKSYDLQNNSIAILFPEGSEDIVRLPANFVATQGQIGMLALVSGIRDRASRLIEAANMEIVREPAIHVTSPQPNSTVNSPLVVLGFANVTEQKLYWRLRDHADQTIAEGFANLPSQQAAGFGPFRFEVFLPGMEEQDFSFELYRKDGSGVESASVRLPLTLLTKRRSLFDVYFGKSGKNVACGEVAPVSRAVAATASASRAAVSELFAGPTQEESQAGLTSALPEGAGLISLRVQDRIAHLEITTPVKATPCQVQGTRAQLEKTLRQFPEIDEVEIIGLE